MHEQLLLCSSLRSSQSLRTSSASSFSFFFSAMSLSLSSAPLFATTPPPALPLLFISGLGSFADIALFLAIFIFSAAFFTSMSLLASRASLSSLVFSFFASLLLAASRALSRRSSSMDRDRSSSRRIASFSANLRSSSSARTLRRAFSVCHERRRSVHDVRTVVIAA